MEVANINLMLSLPLSILPFSRPLLTPDFTRGAVTLTLTEQMAANKTGKTKMMKCVYSSGMLMMTRLVATSTIKCLFYKQLGGNPTNLVKRPLSRQQTCTEMHSLQLLCHSPPSSTPTASHVTRDSLTQHLFSR